MHRVMGDLKLGPMAIRYSLFVPKLYNYCLSLGFERARMMPSRAFCSDESQGYPVILLTQHFGTFPFDHGRVGGKVATDRHGPHAHHGEDLIIVQASHVGYDPEAQRFGVYRRQRTADGGFGANCGKLSGVLDWYRQRYADAQADIELGEVDGVPAVFIDNALLDETRAEGLFLYRNRLIDPDRPAPLRVLSTSKALALTPSMSLEGVIGKQPIGARLTADLFYFRREPVFGAEGLDQLDAELKPAMPQLVTSAHPELEAARHHTQLEFDRTYRTILREPAYRDKNVLFVSGLHVDVSPDEHMLFPLTKFVPWAAFIRMRDGRSFVLEQDELFRALMAQPSENPDQISFDAAIQAMVGQQGIELPDL
jgi:hypothetical protein